jgi:peptide-methionine (S)-S-oxide reductase
MEKIMRKFGLCLALLASTTLSAAAEDVAKVIPAPATDNPRTPGEPQTAVLAGGCYWGMQAIFEHVKGIKSVVAGFSGPYGTPGQDDLISRGHKPAEAVRITFDPAQITYGQLLQIYFSVAHDPTQVDKQGPDEGPQYRSDIFYGDDTQKKIAEDYIAQLDATHIYHASIATRVDSLSNFHKVPVSEQDYVVKHPTAPYVTINDLPRIAALKIVFPSLYLDPPLTASTD